MNVSRGSTPQEKLRGKKIRMTKETLMRKEKGVHQNKKGTRPWTSSSLARQLASYPPVNRRKSRCFLRSFLSIHLWLSLFPSASNNVDDLTWSSLNYWTGSNLRASSIEMKVRVSPSQLIYSSEIPSPLCIPAFCTLFSRSNFISNRAAACLTSYICHDVVYMRWAKRAQRKRSSHQQAVVYREALRNPLRDILQNLVAWKLTQTANKSHSHWERAQLLFLLSLPLRKLRVLWIHNRSACL